MPVSICLPLPLNPFCNSSSNLAILLINDVPNAGVCSSCFGCCCLACLLLVNGDFCEGLHWMMLLSMFAFTRCLNSAYLLGVCPLTVASGVLSSFLLSSLMVLLRLLIKATAYESSWSENATPHSTSTDTNNLEHITNQHAGIVCKKYSSIYPSHDPFPQGNEID